MIHKLIFCALFNELVVYFGLVHTLTITHKIWFEELAKTMNLFKNRNKVATNFDEGQKAKL